MATDGRRFFLVERYVPSMSADAVASAARRLGGPGEGPTRHLCTLLVRDEETCLSVFEAPDVAAVAVANERARFALDRIVEIDLLEGARPRARPRASSTAGPPTGDGALS